MIVLTPKMECVTYACTDPEFWVDQKIRIQNFWVFEQNFRMTFFRPKFLFSSQNSWWPILYDVGIFDDIKSFWEILGDLRNIRGTRKQGQSSPQI